MDWHAVVELLVAIAYMYILSVWPVVEGGTSASKYANYGRLVRGMYLMTVPGRTNVSFRTYDGVDLEQCGRECMLRTKCLSFNYGRKNSTCELNDVTADNSVSARLVVRKGFVYSEKATWPVVCITHMREHTHIFVFI
jgi:hypothetical protein